MNSDATQGAGIPVGSGQKTVAPYGAWRSPISADVMLQAAVRLGGVQLDGDDIYWLEGRPGEAGRNVVVRLSPGSTDPLDVTPSYEAGRSKFDVRTAVYSYGGGAWLVDAGTLYFTNYRDGRLYRQASGSEQPIALTPAGLQPNGKDPLRSYADGSIDRGRNRWIGVVEDWSAVEPDNADERKRQPRHSIVAVDLSGGTEVIQLLQGRDFYAAPRLSPDGRWLACLAWDHPQMPWQGTELLLVELDGGGQPGAAPVVVDGSAGISICQPEWSPDGTELWFVSDRSGWWNLYRYDVSTRHMRQVVPMDAEFSGPQWNLATSSYAFLQDGSVIAAYSQNGLMKLAVIDADSGRHTGLELPFTSYGFVRASPSGRIAFLAGAPRTPSSVVVLDSLKSALRVLKASTNLADDVAINRHFSTVEPVTFPTTRGHQAHALFYPPANADYAGPAGERPPVVVLCHGGPTAQASSVLSLGIQYWTSRGIAVLDVNYRGSSGYGRAYRDLLEESWGIVDVEDCIAGVEHLGHAGRVDAARAVITGGSAGGFTTLAALTFHDFFRAGASHYGIGDLETLAQHTHKFESHYLDWLVGPYPQTVERYRDRSPRYHTDRLATPVIFLHGEDDKVVPPEQAEQMVDVIKAKGLPFGFLLFAGEGHGFRQRDNIRRAIEAEHDFFSFQVFRSRMSLGQPAVATGPKPEGQTGS
jgi:dipeptidyl aminopeptidase/acylaminoacyl peptidase